MSITRSRRGWTPGASAFACAMAMGFGTSAYAAPDAAIALGPGTTFTSIVALDVPRDRTLFLSDGAPLAELRDPVGSCRFHFRHGIRELTAGRSFQVRNVSVSTSPHEDRGVSRVTWQFRESDPVDSLVCDTVGNTGPNEYDVQWSMKGVFSIAPATLVSAD